MGEGWHAVNLDVARDDVEMAAHLLHEQGCNDVVEEDAPDAGRVRLTAYFDASRDPKDRLAINGIADIAVVPSIGDISGPFDIVVANILLLTLLELREPLIARCAPGGFLILSGITHDQEERIYSAFSPPLALRSAARRDEWSCMVFARGSA